jgi:hypothetical protein
MYLLQQVAGAEYFAAQSLDANTGLPWMCPRKRNPGLVPSTRQKSTPLKGGTLSVPYPGVLSASNQTTGSKNKNKKKKLDTILEPW